ncbi:nickel-dependent hydrogenase large subunit [uncultured Desulfobacter sp.]|jgi:coenzyme F420-reducing hydrogenase alpha subunit|uniref:Ni/Fe hydrogenase subunit alpha n=1 Tax=uncultured Desulfobacter sp. TaxID=240139 RepID=UPI0029C5FE21|nr:nickel-dependent hydrogenase large subunit [uncultured Desulfobacter sp.]
MKKDINIDVHHLTRVEGHGNIKVNIKSGVVEECVWQVPEAPRFFEAMIKGRHYSEVARITSRICGICAIGHTLASVKATESALGIEITPQTATLRSILKHAENFDSHIVHVGVLVAPDLLGAPSVFPLVATHGDVIKTVLRLKRLGHEWGSMIGGRTTHPTTVVPGGFAKLITTDELKILKDKILARVGDLTALVETIVSLASDIPVFDRPTEYVALHSDEEYGLYDGCIQTVMPDGSKEQFDVRDYKKVTNEWVSPNSTAKYTRHNLESYAAGALARFNNNYEQLHPEAKKIAEVLGMKPIVGNPYLNSAAQVVECAHNVHESLRMIDEILAGGGIKEEGIVQPVKFSSGTGSTEVPRGILFHEYNYDENGFCIDGNCIIPTNQNHANIQADFDKLVPELLEADKTKEEMELALEMLVRAYDPCISCSTHYLNVEFVG